MGLEVRGQHVSTPGSNIATVSLCDDSNVTPDVTFNPKSQMRLP